MHNLSLKQLAVGLKQKKFSSLELCQFFLDRIEKFDHKLNSFITVNSEYVFNQAKLADQKLAKSNSGPLTGIPIAHKDIFCTEGIKTSCGSKILDNFISPYDATMVKKLNAANMVTIGKTNMDEFAMGSSNENSYYGPVNNPWNFKKVPGGSSGGSAACIAARLVPAATGTDTGGSIRQPAAFCGITGLKPTYGRVSRYGMVAFASSLDQAGPMASSAEDCALLLEAMAGFDPLDSTSQDISVERYSTELEQSIKGLRIGLPNEFFNSNLADDIKQNIDATIKVLEFLGAKIKAISLENFKTSIPAYYVISSAECSSNMSRFDGVRYGHRSKQAQDLNSLYCNSRSEGFGDEVKRRIMIGTYALSAGYYNAYYHKAQQIRTLISRSFQTSFQDVDFILGPTTPSVAFNIGEKINDPISMYLSDLYTVAVNLAGLPALSMPAGFSNKLPVGVQLIGNHFSEARLLNIAHLYQQITDWHTQIPEEFR